MDFRMIWNKLDEWKFGATNEISELKLGAIERF
jgi:hypothetical protein